MANTYTQLYVHIVFAVKDRDALISEEIETQLYPYIAGACKNRKHHLIAIGGMPDHVHMLVGMAPTESISEFVQSIKIQTSKWIHETFGRRKFGWQSGYGAFTYSKSLLPPVERYILKQKEHHKKKSFDEEFREILEKAGIEYDERYALKGC